MRLRNKKTGEILASLGSFIIQNPNHVNCEAITKYDSLAELNEEWEDYKEDELIYVISAEHKSGYQCVLKEDYPEICKVAKELGIGFESEKECRKAVEKLKAWKRLEDKGFRFDGYDLNYGHYKANFVFNKEAWLTETKPDLDFLFGGRK